MLYGWGPNEAEMEGPLTELSQEHLDEEGSDDEQSNCTNDIEETEVLAVSYAYRASDNGLSFGSWDVDNLWEDVEDGEESVFDASASCKHSRKK